MLKYFLLMLILIPARVMSQFKFSGTVKDSFNTPLQFASILITDGKNKENDIHFLSDSTGHFEFLLKKESYTLQIKCMGFEDFNHTYEVTKTNNIGTIYLKMSSNNLKEVQINGDTKLISRKIDRVIFNVEKSIQASGGDAIDALKIAPGVKILNDEIRMTGKSGVQLMVNNRIIQLSSVELSNYLKSIKTADIARIELISNPPANYDAQGNSGIINIILKKVKKDSFNGYVRSSYTQTTYAAGNVSGGFNYNKNKLSLFSSVQTGDGSTAPLLKNDVFYPNQSWKSTSTRRNYYKSVSGRFGVDYDINKHSAIGAQYIGSVSSWNIKDQGVTNITGNNGQPDSSIITDAYSKSNDHSHGVNLHFQTQLDTNGKKLSIDADYLLYANDKSRIFTSDTYNEHQNFIPGSRLVLDNLSNQGIKVYTSNVDFVLPYKYVNITVGGKISFINNKSNINTFDLSSAADTYLPSQSNVFRYSENTQAAYLSGNKKLSKKWEAKAGIRLENTQTEGYSALTDENTTNSYLKVFPTFYLTYQGNQANMFSLSYGRRIGRPKYESLNPFRYYSNPFSYTEGNSMLQPSFTDNVEVSHTYKDNLTSTIYASRTLNGYGQITTITPNSNIQATTVSNYYKSYQAGFSQTYTLKPVKYWESYNQLMVYYNVSKSSAATSIPDLKGLSGYFSSNNSFALNKKRNFYAELNYYYQFPEAMALYKYRAYSQLDIATKITIKRFDLSLALADIFKTAKINSSSHSNSLEYQFHNYFDTRQARLSLNYRFGNAKLRSKQKNAGNEEERKRTN